MCLSWPSGSVMRQITDPPCEAPLRLQELSIQFNRVNLPIVISDDKATDRKRVNHCFGFPSFPFPSRIATRATNFQPPDAVPPQFTGNKGLVNG